MTNYHEILTNRIEEHTFAKHEIERHLSRIRACIAELETGTTEPLHQLGHMTYIILPGDPAHCTLLSSGLIPYSYLAAVAAHAHEGLVRPHQLARALRHGSHGSRTSSPTA